MRKLQLLITTRPVEEERGVDRPVFENSETSAVLESLESLF